eukprot:scaffold1220_cov376-Prasinococcus_capsulatus_cf.AAC.5
MPIPNDDEALDIPNDIIMSPRTPPKVHPFDELPQKSRRPKRKRSTMQIDSEVELSNGQMKDMIGDPSDTTLERPVKRIMPPTPTRKLDKERPSSMNAAAPYSKKLMELWERTVKHSTQRNIMQAVDEAVNAILGVSPNEDSIVIDEPEQLRAQQTPGSGSEGFTPVVGSMDRTTSQRRRETSRTRGSTAGDLAFDDAGSLGRLSHDADIPLLPEEDDESPHDTVRPPSLGDVLGTVRGAWSPGLLVETYKSTQRDPCDSMTKESEAVFSSLAKKYASKNFPDSMSTASLFRAKDRSAGATIFYQLLGGSVVICGNNLVPVP